MNYTSHIPCNGVEEPRSTEMSGLGLRVVFESVHVDEIAGCMEVLL